jgi:hypothetical protein
VADIRAVEVTAAVVRRWCGLRWHWRHRSLRMLRDDETRRDQHGRPWLARRLVPRRGRPWAALAGEECPHLNRPVRVSRRRAQCEVGEALLSRSFDGDSWADPGAAQRDRSVDRDPVYGNQAEPSES